MPTEPQAGDAAPSRGDALRLPAEVKYQDELSRLRQWDQDRGEELPPGWKLSARAVRAFVIGHEGVGVTRKFYGDDPLVDRCVVTLLGRQGLMLAGPPGTAKSMLSELLSAAVSGNSNLTVQGTAGTTEDHIRYSWNYALLLAEGPSRRSLVPSPICQAMELGAVARFEEITRAAPEIQDTMVSILSEKQLMIPELGSDARVAAKPGFNVIATANLRDRGVNEMSAALKRRFNFEAVNPIADPAFEVQLVSQQVDAELGDRRRDVKIDRDVLELLVTAFRDLRSGTTAEGAVIKRPETAMSTAEAVNVAVGAALEARYLGDGKVTAGGMARQLLGAALKDNQEDAARLDFYLDTVVRERARRSRAWKDFQAAAKTWR
ncbi:MAG: AAA family ATPase [Bifidobacteriaceae bacterium]|nr:AAA family ATPase [Bifidobacteriaceae bacterium]